jgi:Concanavalin A-like lectin/glucanases superfamily
MCRKLMFLVSLALLLVPAGSAVAQIDPATVTDGDVYLFENVGTDVPDDSANSNTATLIGNPQVVDGLNGKALKFNGTSDGVLVPDAATINTSTHQNHTVIAVFNCADVTKPEKQCVFDEGGSTRGLNIYVYQGSVYVGAWNRADYTPQWNPGTFISTPIASNEWHAVAAVLRDGGPAQEDDKFEMWLDGRLIGKGPGGQLQSRSDDNGIANVQQQTNFHDGTVNAGYWFEGMIDEVWILDRALTEDELSQWIGKPWPYAFAPNPADGTEHADTWVSLSWKPGAFVVSHDVYLGEDFTDVNNATRDSDLFRGNQTTDFYVAGFPGYAYPDGLVPGTTYYWRIDEVNDAEPNSPWKGDVWSFSIPPKTGYNPDPADGAEGVPVTAKLTWTAGFGAKLHTVYFGDDFDTVANAAGGAPQGTPTYTPSGLKKAKTYYWRVDEFDGTDTYKGDVWSFTTEGAVGGPNPANGAVDVKPTTLLTWTAGAIAASHEVYFGTDPNAVKNATNTSPEYKGSKALGDESYDPGKLELETRYYWRIDEVNTANPDSPWKGNVWSFTTGDFYVIDDFESYTDDDANNLAIWQTWVDGYGVADNGAQVGYLMPPYAEQTVVHGGAQSMPLLYNNTAGVTNSEVSLAMTVQGDWTEGGVAELSLWFRGSPGSVGSFVEGPVGTYTMTATGADIWNQADEFHFAYKMLTGVGSIEAEVLSVDNTNAWAKAGVMIRETLDAGSKFAAVYITPANGCRFQARMDTDIAATSDTGVVTTEQTAITAPYRVKLERDVAGNFRGYYSSDGTTWTPMSWNPQSILMGSNVYIGLALTAHNANATCTAKFSNVKITGTVGPQWADQDIGIASNALEPLYVAVSNSAGSPAIVTNPDPNAATTTTWTQWVVPLSAFSDQGINLSNVDKLAIGLGTKGNATAAGGSGTMYFDDIRLNRPQP